MKQDLREYGFTTDIIELRCRLCGGIIHKYGYAILLGSSVRYGWCRRYTHGISVAKIMK